MRTNTIIKIISLILLLSLNVTNASTNFIEGEKRYVGFLDISGSEIFFVLNKKTNSPLKIKIDIGDYKGLMDLNGNSLDLVLDFNKSCQTRKDCKAKVVKTFGIYAADRRIPNYIFLN